MSFWTVWQLEGAELYPWPCVLRRADYDDGTFRSMADALVSKGLKDAGYEYMLVQVRGLCVHCCFHSHRGASLCEGLWCSAASSCICTCRPCVTSQECIVPKGARDPVTGVVQPDPVKCVRRPMK